MDERPELTDDELEAPPPIGLPSRELAIMLAEALSDLHSQNQKLDEETTLVMIAAAIEANNRQLYQDLRELGVLDDLPPKRLDDELLVDE
jgi:hypothetical protein